MSDLLNIGTQSVLTAQKQLNTTGHNISNVNTEGYSRQSVMQGTNDPRFYGGQTYGMGVHVENVRRSWDQFAVKEVNLASTHLSHRTNIEENYDLLSSMLSSNTSKKVPENLNAFFNSVKSLADTPNDMGARKVVLENAKHVAQNLNDFHESARRYKADTNTRLDVSVKRMNQLAHEIRDVHRLMIRSSGPHNDLMDKHEKLVKELSEFTKVTVIQNKDKEGFNVHIGNGHMLVSGTEASQLAIVDGYPDVHQHRLAMVEGDGIKPISEKDIDGELQAILEMRDKQIPSVLDELGLLSTSFALELNQLQKQGLDLHGNIGEHMFADMNSEEIATSRVIKGSQSTADMAAFIEDISQVQSGEYEIQYTGSDYLVTLPSGEQQSMQINNSTSQPSLQLDGIRIEVRSSMDVGERVLVRPTRTGAKDIQIAINDPAQIAAQSFEASTTFAQGTAEFTIDNAGDTSEFEVQISADGSQFRVVDPSGNQLRSWDAYPPSGVVQVDSSVIDPTTFILSEGALPNDRFTANLNSAEGDNGNLIKMQELQSQKRLNDHESTIVDIYQNLNTDVGLQMATASRLTDVARLEKTSAEERVASVSGVNLDEEAANMMKFQQAYMASSRIMEASNEAFNRILQIR
ncbi:flagellar hook-associated protein FlgK [Vibrio sp.]|nr:flagellar hook-associated protein FlgK [Vibrio sp.]